MQLQAVPGDCGRVWAAVEQEDCAVARSGLLRGLQATTWIVQVCRACKRAGEGIRVTPRLLPVPHKSLFGSPTVRWRERAHPPTPPDHHKKARRGNLGCLGGRHGQLPSTFLMIPPLPPLAPDCQRRGDGGVRGLGTSCRPRRRRHPHRRLLDIPGEQRACIH